MDVVMKGPVVDGTAAHVIDVMSDAVAEAVSQDAYESVHKVLRSVLKHPTGYYESRVQQNRQAHDYVVNDSGVVYGPWLEGAGSRNGSTKFKGYQAFRKVTQDVQQRVLDIAQPEVSKGIEKLQ